MRLQADVSKANYHPVDYETPCLRFYLETQLINLSPKITVICYNMVFVGQTNLLFTLVQNCNEFIYQRFINSHTQFKQVRIISVISKSNKANVKFVQSYILLPADTHFS